MRPLFFATLLLSVLTTPSAQLDFNDDATLQKTFDRWNEPVVPFRVIGNIYFVGMRNISSFLITSPEGHILIDTGFSNSVPIIQSNILQLGFAPRDIKYILSSHAHADHVAGHAAMKRITGAKIVISQSDAELLRSGGKLDFLFGNSRLMQFEPVEPDLIIKDAAPIHLGQNALTAHLTPGHTPGCTTWTMHVKDGNRDLNVVFFGSTSINPGTKFFENDRYPTIAEDLKRTYQKLLALSCDVFLAPHPEQFHMQEKLDRRGSTGNPFIDPDGYREYLDTAQRAFHAELETQKRTANRTN